MTKAQEEHFIIILRSFQCQFQWDLCFIFIYIVLTDTILTNTHLSKSQT